MSKVTKDFQRDGKGRILKGREYKVIDRESRKVMFLTQTKVVCKKKDFDGF